MTDESKPIPDKPIEPPLEATNSKSSPAEEYVVGPGRPPKEHTWKKGRPTPNPTGRRGKNPSMEPDLKRLFENVLKKKVKVTKDQKKQFLSRLELGFEQLANQFAKGDRHARRDVFMISEKLGVDLMADARKAIGAIAPDHQAILDSYVTRRTAAPDKPTLSPVIAPAELLDDDVSDSGQTAEQAPTVAAPPKLPPRTAQEIHDERVALRKENPDSATSPTTMRPAPSTPAANGATPQMAESPPNAPVQAPKPQPAPIPPSTPAVIQRSAIGSEAADAAQPHDSTVDSPTPQPSVSKPPPEASSMDSAAASPDPDTASSMDLPPAPPPVKRKPWGQMTEREKQEHFLMINKRRDR